MYMEKKYKEVLVLAKIGYYNYNSAVFKYSLNKEY